MRALDELGVKVSVELAAPADLDALVALLGHCVHEMQSRGLDQWDDVYPNRATLAADVAGATLYRALRAGANDVIGSFTLNQTQDPEYAEVPWQIADGPVAVVHRLMVHPSAQRLGLGSYLMRFAERRAHELGFRALRLDTFKKNQRALALYRSLGYLERGDVRFRKGVFACFEKALRQA
jgi:ribosomal protein S18 acetylase RimI-like enzyme